MVTLDEEISSAIDYSSYICSFLSHEIAILNVVCMGTSTVLELVQYKFYGTLNIKLLHNVVDMYDFPPLRCCMCTAKTTVVGVFANPLHVNRVLMDVCK